MSSIPTQCEVRPFPHRSVDTTASTSITIPQHGTFGFYGVGMELSDILGQALRHFVHLDESNAAMHCAPVRYSPITFRLAEAAAEVGVPAWADTDMIRVLDDAGTYIEDTGR